MFFLRVAHEDPQAHPEVGDERCAGDGQHLRGVGPRRRVDQEGMKVRAGEPEDGAAPPDTAQGGHGKAHRFSTGRLLPGCKGPILIQEKAVDRAQTVGQRAVNQKCERAAGREEP
jgi:hypothetical protein